MRERKRIEAMERRRKAVFERESENGKGFTGFLWWDIMVSE